VRRFTRAGGFWRIALWLVVCIPWAGLAAAHEVRPAFLQITQRPDHLYDVLWKQPTADLIAVRLVPRISGGLLDGPPAEIASAPDFQIRLWRGLRAGPRGLEGRTLRIEGLERTITDVLVSIAPSSGNATHHILSPTTPGLMFDSHTSDSTMHAYLTLGMEHILTGVDHLLFVLALILLVGPGRDLVTIVTTFTVAHSITLVATTLRLIPGRLSLLEPLVALSILFVAVELVHRKRGRSGLTARFPWLTAFVFGLLHGSAFAGALAQIGLPPEAIPLSLLMFNVGVELGQLLFICGVVSLGWMLTRLRWELPAWTQQLPSYAIGSCAAMFFLERLRTVMASMVS
jgi:hydrogenase/urease accessory protein HupE